MWTGQRYDATTRLYHFLFRTYSPRLGRWLQRDPAGYVDGVCLYEYARGTPSLTTDPLGLLAQNPDPSYWPPPLNSGPMAAGDYSAKEKKNRKRSKPWPLAAWLLWATGGNVSWLDDEEFVNNVSLVFEIISILTGVGAEIKAIHLTKNGLVLFLEGGYTIMWKRTGGWLVRIFSVSGDLGRPTLTLFVWRGVVRFELHPTRNWLPWWYLTPHIHLDIWQTIRKLHIGTGVLETGLIAWFLDWLFKDAPPVPKGSKWGMEYWPEHEYIGYGCGIR
jgi:RHS repeat-associated protein